MGVGHGQGRQPEATSVVVGPGRGMRGVGGAGEQREGYRGAWGRVAGSGGGEEGGRRGGWPPWSWSPACGDSDGSGGWRRQWEVEWEVEWAMAGRV